MKGGRAGGAAEDGRAANGGAAIGREAVDEESGRRGGHVENPNMWFETWLQWFVSG